MNRDTTTTTTATISSKLNIQLSNPLGGEGCKEVDAINTSGAG